MWFKLQSGQVKDMNQKRELLADLLEDGSVASLWHMIYIMLDCSKLQSSALLGLLHCGEACGDSNPAVQHHHEGLDRLRGKGLIRS